MSKTVSIPMVLPIGNRSSPPIKDQKIANGYAEIIRKNTVMLVKRPGIEFHLQMPIV